MDNLGPIFMDFHPHHYLTVTCQVDALRVRVAIIELKGNASIFSPTSLFNSHLPGGCTASARGNY
jgi:hypothetical protein